MTAVRLDAWPWHCPGNRPECHSGNPCGDACRPRPPAPTPDHSNQEKN